MSSTMEVQNPFSLSESITCIMPNLHIRSKTKFAKWKACLVEISTASSHLLMYSTATHINLLPLLLSLNGPARSIPHLSKIRIATKNRVQLWSVEFGLSEFLARHTESDKFLNFLVGHWPEIFVDNCINSVVLSIWAPPNSPWTLSMTI